MQRFKGQRPRCRWPALSSGSCIIQVLLMLYMSWSSSFRCPVAARDVGQTPNRRRQALAQRQAGTSLDRYPDATPPVHWRALPLSEPRDVRRGVRSPSDASRSRGSWPAACHVWIYPCFCGQLSVPRIGPPVLTIITVRPIPDSHLDQNFFHNIANDVINILVAAPACRMPRKRWDLS